MEFRDVRLCGGGKLVPARYCAGLGERSFIMLVTVLVALTRARVCLKLGERSSKLSPMVLVTGHQGVDHREGIQGQAEAVVLVGCYW